MPSAHVAALRQLLVDRYPDATREPSQIAAPVSTGVGSLDALLPRAGLPRGRLTTWAPGGGSVAILRAACGAVAERGERAAWCELADGVTAWSDSDDGRQFLIRTDDLICAQRAADHLLSSGAFALVVLANMTAVGSRTVHLARAAHEGGAVAVAIAEHATGALLRITSRLTPSAYRLLPGMHDDPAAIVEASVAVRVRAPGWNRSGAVRLAVRQHDLRVSLDPGLADRRGVDR